MFIGFGFSILILPTFLVNNKVNTLIIMSEIFQFLCLFSLVNIYIYPESLNNLYQSQGIYNFDFVYLILPFAKIDTSNDEYLPGNIGNHPSINGYCFIFNFQSIFWSYISIIIFSFLALLFCTQISMKCKKAAYWGMFLDLVKGSFNDLLLLSFVQIFLVL